MSGSRGRTYIKTYQTENGLLVAACDEEVLGLRLEDKSRGVSFYVDPHFFNGGIVDLREAIELLKKAAMANIVGNRIVESAVREGLVLEDSVLVVGGVKVAMFITLQY
jgi:hypothetical protein